MKLLLNIILYANLLLWVGAFTCFVNCTRKQNQKMRARMNATRKGYRMKEVEPIIVQLISGFEQLAGETLDSCGVAT
jgi:hypothetical protein